MPFVFVCPQCGKKLNLADTLQDRMIPCTGCQAPVRATPTTTPAPKEPAPAALDREDVPVDDRRSDDRAPEPRRRPRRDAEDEPRDRQDSRFREDDRDRDRERAWERDRSRSRAAPPRNQGGSGWIFALIGGIAGVFLLCCGGVGTMIYFAKPTVSLTTSSGVVGPGTNPNINPGTNPNVNPGINPNGNPNTPQQERLALAGDQLTVHPGGTQMVHVSDGKTLAALGEDGVVKILNIPQPNEDQRTWTVRAVSAPIPGPWKTMAHDGNRVYLALVAGNKVYVLTNHDARIHLQPTFTNPVAAAVEPSATAMIVAVGTDTQGELYYRSLGNSVFPDEQVVIPKGVTDIAKSQDTRSTLAVAIGGDLCLYNTAARSFPPSVTHSHTAPIRGLAFAPNYQSLVTVGGDKMVKRWSVPELHLGKQPVLLNTYEGHTNPTGRPAFSPDGTRLVTFGGPGDEVVRLWETKTGKQLSSRVLTPAQIGNVDFLPDGKTVVIAVRREPLRLWDVSGFQAPPGPPGK